MDRERKALMKLLRQGESLRVAFYGSPDTRSLSTAILDEVFSRESPSVQDMRPIYIGVTEEDLLLAQSDRWGKPLEPHRWPLRQVFIAEYKEGMISDLLTFSLGENKKLQLQVGRNYRQDTRQLIDILSRQGQYHSGS